MEALAREKCAVSLRGLDAHEQLQRFFGVAVHRLKAGEDVRAPKSHLSLKIGELLSILKED